MSTPVAILDGVFKSFGTSAGPTPVLEDVRLTIGRGEKASLVGPSGSGKSTLLSLIAGLLRPDSGTVQIDGALMSVMGDRQRARLRTHQIGIALQADNLIPFLSARENIELALGFGSRQSRVSVRARALDLLERFGVGHRADHRPRQLSGGEAQRVALAVSMANQPALLLADEVVSSLDGETAGQVVDEVLDADFAVLYVTHDIALADRVDRRYALEGQKLVPR